MTGDHGQSGRLRSEDMPPSSLPGADQAGDLVDDLFRAHAVTLVRVATLLLGNLYRLDLATGRVTRLNASWAVDSAIAG
jgi:hypothetical protein